MRPEIQMGINYPPTTKEKPNEIKTPDCTESIGDVAYLEHRVDDLADQAGVEEAAWQKFRLVMSELRDYSPKHYAHSLRVGLYSHGIAKTENHNDLKLPLFAGIGHDIGKLAVSKNVLDSDGPLSAQEYEEVKQHTYAGYEILSSSDFPFTAVIAGSHHFFRKAEKSYGVDLEKLPSLTNAEKYIAANMVRIVMVSDDFDARMTRADNNNRLQLSLGEHLAQMSTELPLSDSRISWLATNKI